ncbi:hypothetical protein KJ953_02200 [Patescibacteria group bacterium]|nr:hypothetical protein [Patescibacteria group bacterium]MBU1256852.1 hypothetical protein [Patescibacteria group bacterium]MBU1457872.1 hypothetical protein [Patescibacteria group bacterium]
MNGAGGIGKQVLGELGDVVKKVAEDTGKAGVDIVKGVIGGAPHQAVQGDEEQVEMGDRGQKADSISALGRQASIKKQKGLQRVREELADYVNKKKQEDEHKEAVEERQVEVNKDQEEQVRESERDMQIRQAQRSGGGTGEMSRKKH